MDDDEIAEIRRRRPAMRATLACSGMRLTGEEEALFDGMERDRLDPEERIARLMRYNREKIAKEGGCR